MFQQFAFLSIFCCDTLHHGLEVSDSCEPNQIAYGAYSSKLTAAKGFYVC